MDNIHLKLIKSGHIIKDSEYLSLFTSTLPEDYNILSTTVNYELDTVKETVNKL
jgi:hypothetical protein